MPRPLSTIAAKSFQRFERNLTYEQKVTIMDLFETNTTAADMFLAVNENDEGLQWAWISHKLEKMGHLASPPCNTVGTSRVA